MQNTPNFGLRKPDYNEFADVNDLNYNADIIDTALENHQVDIDSYNQAILDLQNNTQKATTAEAIAGTSTIKVASPASIKSFTDANTLSRRGAITSSANFNSIIDPGAYFINQQGTQSLNFPVGAVPSGTLVVISSTGTGRVVQQYFSSNGITYTRSRVDNVWNGWESSDSTSSDAIKKSLSEDYLNAIDKTLKVNKTTPEIQPSGNYSMTVQNNKDNPSEHGLFVGGRYADFSTKLLEASVLFGENGLGVYPAFVVDGGRNTRVFGKLLINDIVDVESEINSLKSSVSSGKAQIASAITGKGVPTASDASFSTMATNISNIGSNFSSGTVFSTGSGDFKLFGSSSTLTSPFVEITGLTFTPILIILRRIVGENIYETTYDSRAISQRGFISSNTNSNNGTSNNFSTNTLPAYINNTSFKAPVVSVGEYVYYIYG